MAIGQGKKGMASEKQYRDAVSFKKLSAFVCIIQG